MEEKKPLISVIVPVYNVENYLHKCVDSILAQTLKSFELILVNDGSPDNCGAICDEYARKDERVQVIHKPNGGVSSARNAGIDAAKGKWICFVDSDDYVDINYLSGFNTSEGVDIAFQGYKVVDDDGKVSEIHMINQTNLDTLQLIAVAEDYYIINSPCFKLFKKENVSVHQLSFDEKISYGEDHLFSLAYMLYAEKCSYTSNMGYFVRRSNNNSLTNRTIPLDEIIYYTESSRRLHEKLLKFYKSKDTLVISSFNRRFYKNISRAYNDIIRRGDDKWQEIQTLRNYCKLHKKWTIKGLSVKERLKFTYLLYAPLYFFR